MKHSSYLVTLIKIARDSGITGLGELFYIIVAYIISFVISRFLGAEGVGIYAQATTVVMLILLLARSGLEGGVLRFVSSYLARRDYAYIDGMTLFATRLILVTSIFWGVLLFVSADALGNRIWHEPQLVFVLRMFALTIPFSALTNIWLSGIQAFQRIEYRVYLERIFMPLVTIALVGLFLFWGWRWWGVTLGTLLPVLMGTIFAYYIYHSLRRSFTIETGEPGFEIKKWVGFCMPMLLSGILAFLIARMATLLLGYFRDSREVGIYDIAVKVALMVELPLVVSNVVFAPLIGEMYTQGDLVKLQALFKTVTKWVFTASLLVFLVATLLAQPILQIFGPEFSAGVPVLFILSFGQLVNAGTGAVGWMLIMSGHSTLHLINSVLSALLTIMLSFLLMPSYGMIGAAIAVGLVNILMNAARLAEVFSLLRIHPYRWDFIKPVVAGLITLGCVYLLQRHLLYRIYSSFWVYIMVIGAILILYFTSLILFQLRQEEKDVLNWAFQKIHVS